MSNMKAFLIVLLFGLMAMSCSGQTLRLVWEVPQSYDSLEVQQYILYKWQGDQAAKDSFKLADMDSFATLPHVQNNYNYDLQTWFDPKLQIRGGVIAEDIRGRRSGMTLSPFYDKPKDLDKVVIQR